MIAIGAELKAWAITVSGYGTIIETDEKEAHKQAKHYDLRGRAVSISELGPVVKAKAPEPEKPLLWNQVAQGYYWAFPKEEGISRPHFVMVTGPVGRPLFWMDGEDFLVDDYWAGHVYVPCKPPERADFDFSEVPIDSGLGDA